MHDLTRRSVLSALPMAALVPAGRFTQSTTRTTTEADRPAPETFGPAAVTAAVVAMATDGSTAYLVTRGQTPPKVVTVDLPGKAVRKIARLPRGDGGWAATVSQGQVYVGTYPHGDLYRLDPATGDTELIGTLVNGSGFVWCLTTAPDGTVYAGTSPGCGVWEYNPSTRVLKDLGRADTSTEFARVIAADEKYVYVGTTPQRHLVAIDRVTGERRDIVPPEVAGPGALYAMAVNGGRVLATIESALIDVAPDGSDAKVMRAPNAQAPLDALTVGPDGQVYCIARRQGNVYRRVGDALERVGEENVGDESRALLVQGDTLVGCGGSGILWYRDLSGGASTETFDLTGTDVAGPDLIQSVSLDPGRAVYVGGHYNLSIHEPWRGKTRRARVAGEPKALLPLNGKVIAALYPSSEVIEFDPSNSRTRSFGTTGFQRPWEMVHDDKRGLVLIVSAPGTGILTGALTILDLRTGSLTSYPDVLPDQAVISVTRVGRIAYLAGDTYGGGSVTPTRPTAQVAAFDLERREVLWRIEPLPAAPSLQHIEVHDNMLYGVYRRVGGTWFALDLGTRQVIHQGKLSGHGEIVVHRDQVFAATNFADNIYRIGPGLSTAKLLAGPIATSWFTVPQLEFEPDSWHAWGASDRDLARFDLDPRYG